MGTPRISLPRELWLELGMGSDWGSVIKALVRLDLMCDKRDSALAELRTPSFLLRSERFRLQRLGAIAHHNHMSCGLQG
jgi:hypothetical protein